MGINKLFTLLGDYGCLKPAQAKELEGYVAAIDASNFMYQAFSALTRYDGETLTDKDGNTTAHVVNIFHRVSKMLHKGIKPIFVFDGPPPALKQRELDDRAKRRDKASFDLEQAEDQDNKGGPNLFKRLVKVLPSHVEDIKKLLDLMGVPFVQAPCEAEHQCGAIVNYKPENKVHSQPYACISNDADALLVSHRVIRNFSMHDKGKAQTHPMQSMERQDSIEKLGLKDLGQLIDLSILLGTDYLKPIKGIGPVKALQLVQEFGSIENILLHLATLKKKDGQLKYEITQEFRDTYPEVRQFLLNPPVTDPATLQFKWQSPNTPALLAYLVEDKGFNKETTQKQLDKLAKLRPSQEQSRLDAFFTVVKSPKPQPAKPTKKRTQPTKATSKKGKK